MIYFFFYCCIFFSVFIFFLSFLEWDPLKSCLMLCCGVLFMSCYISLGVHIWYSYFIILVFLSGVLSLLTYFCSISNFNFYYNYYYIIFFTIFLCLSFFFFDFNFFYFYTDCNFLIIYYDVSYYYVFWIIVVLLLFLSLISFSLDGVFCVRCL